MASACGQLMHMAETMQRSLCNLPAIGEDRLAAQSSYAQHTQTPDGHQAHGHDLLLMVACGGDIRRQTKGYKNWYAGWIHTAGAPKVMCLIWANGNVTAAHTAQRVA